jgi:hypothetical protein
MPMFNVNVNALETAALWAVAPGTPPTAESAGSPVGAAQPGDVGALTEQRRELVAA